MGVPYLPVTGRPAILTCHWETRTLWEGWLLVVCLLVKCQSSCPSEISLSLTPGLSSYLSFSGEIGMWQMPWKWFYRNGEVQRGLEAGLLLHVTRKSNGFSLVKSLPVRVWKESSNLFLPLRLPWMNTASSICLTTQGARELETGSHSYPT